MNIKDLPFEVQNRILNLCAKVAGDDYKALYEVLTNDAKSILSVSLEYYISEKKLYSMRKEFYERWDIGFGGC